MWRLSSHSFQPPLCRSLIDSMARSSSNPVRQSFSACSLFSLIYNSRMTYHEMTSKRLVMQIWFIALFTRFAVISYRHSTVQRRNGQSSSLAYVSSVRRVVIRLHLKASISSFTDHNKSKYSRLAAYSSDNNRMDANLFRVWCRFSTKI